MASIQDANAFDWRNGDDNYRYKWTCEESLEVNSVNVVLHGEGGEGLSYEPSSLLKNGDTEALFDNILESCGLIIVPSASPADYFTWDYTGYKTANSEIGRVTNLIILANDLFDLPVNLIGGSAGGSMAFAIASRLNRIGRTDLIGKLVIVEAISPYDVRIDGILPAYDGIGPLTCVGPTNEYTLGGELVENEECNFIRMGLPNSNASFDIDTLIVYSADDDVTPFEQKDILAKTIVHFSTIGPATAHIIISGEGHDIGSGGWGSVQSFILD